MSKHLPLAWCDEEGKGVQLFTAKGKIDLQV